MYGPAIVKPNVKISGIVADPQGRPISGVTVRVIDGLITKTDEHGKYALGLYLAEGQTTQLLAIDPDAEKNGGDFASSIVDINLNTKDDSASNMRDRRWMKHDWCGECREWKNCQGSSLHVWDW